MVVQCTFGQPDRLAYIADRHRFITVAQEKLVSLIYNILFCVIHENILIVQYANLHIFLLFTKKLNAFLNNDAKSNQIQCFALSK